MGGISVPCPTPPSHCLCPNEKCAFPSKDYAPKKVTVLVPLECSTGPETPKILVINQVFVGKNRFCKFHDEDLLLFKKFFLGLHPRIRRISRIFRDENLFLYSLSNSREKSFCVPTKIVYDTPVALLWRQAYPVYNIWLILPLPLKPQRLWVQFGLDIFYLKWVWHVVVLFGLFQW